MQPHPSNPRPGRSAASLTFRLWLCAVAVALLFSASPARADRLVLADGTSIEVDEAWEDALGVWYRRGNVTSLLDRARVRRIERGAPARGKGEAGTPDGAGGAETVPAVGGSAEKKTAPPVIWIHLVGGARMEVDEVSETADGVWYKRDRLSVFIDRGRIDHIERDQPSAAVAADATGAKYRSRRWTTGAARLDALIRHNSARFSVDPYLIFLVMEHESNFRTRAVSPAGAKGLMQLMPGTAARFGVRDVFDPAQNVAGGTRYLKELLRMFGGQVDLALASYNAGEGAVMKYGKRVPPYRETRNYVRLIGARYGSRFAPAIPAIPASDPAP